MKAIFAVLVGSLLASGAYCQDGYVKGSPKLAFWKTGTKPKILIVLHGGPGVQHKYLRPELDSLNRYCSVVYYDQRGCGLSEQASTYTWQEHVKDLNRLIKSLSPGKKVFLFGSSWGSSLAMIYAYKHPEDVEGLILSGTYRWGGKNEAFLKKEYSSQVKSHKQTIHETGLIGRRNVDGSNTYETIHIYKETEMYTDAPAFETKDSFISAPIADSLKKVVIPILIFNGSAACEIDRAAEYMSIFPNARLHTIDGACHDPWMSDPKQFALVSNAFISTIGKTFR